IVFGEILVLAIATGLYFSDWVVGVGVAIGLIILLQIKVITAIVLILLSVFWGLVAYAIADYFAWGTGATIAVVLIAAAGTGGAHIGFYEWQSDMDTE
ncbi:MAG: hypothetical protein AB3N28_09350, partial [Kordiimonas sp.]